MRRKFGKRVISVCLAVTMILGSLSGCAGAYKPASNMDDFINNKDTIKLTVFSQTANWSGAQGGWGAVLLKDLFNVELTIIPDTDGTYETRMESGDLGDIVMWGNNDIQYQEAVRQGRLFNWESEDLVKNYGPDIVKYFSQALETNRSINEDNKVYGFGHGATNVEGDHDLFFYDWGIRWDLYQQIGYPEVKNWDDLLETFKKMKEICPTGDDGKPTYAASIWSDWDGDMVMYVKALASGYYGYDELGVGLYDAKDGSFHGALEENGPYLEALKFCNQLYRNNLLDPDSMTQTYDTMISKVRNGNVFFSVFDYAGSIAFNGEEHLAQNKYMASLVPTEAHNIVYKLNTGGNERVWSIGANTLYPEKCMQILNWLCTPEGAMTIWYGPKELMWDYDENGNTYFTDLGRECFTATSTDLSGVEWTSPYTGKTYTLSGTFNDGMLQLNNITWAMGATNPDSNGERFNQATWASQLGEPKNETEADWREKTGAESAQEYLDSTDFSLVPKPVYASAEKNSELDLQWQQVTKAIREGTWKAMYANSDGEFEALVNEMITAADGYGYDACVKWCEDDAALRYSIQK